MELPYHLQVIVKIICSAALLLVYIKVSGKSQLAPMTAFDQIGNIVVGAISGSTLLDPGITVLDSVLFMAVWIFVLVLLRYARNRSMKVKELIDGKRIQLMNNGVLLSENFDKANITAEDVEILVHKEGLSGISQARNIWFEPNGQLTIDKRGHTLMSQILVEEGEIARDNLSRIGRDEAWLQAEIKDKSGLAISEVFMAEWVKEELWVFPYHQKEN